MFPRHIGVLEVDIILSSPSYAEHVCGALRADDNDSLRSGGVFAALELEHEVIRAGTGALQQIHLAALHIDAEGVGGPADFTLEALEIEAVYFLRGRVEHVGEQPGAQAAEVDELGGALAAAGGNEGLLQGGPLRGEAEAALGMGGRSILHAGAEVVVRNGGECPPQPLLQHHEGNPPEAQSLPGTD